MPLLSNINAFIISTYYEMLKGIRGPGLLGNSHVKIHGS